MSALANVVASVVVFGWILAIAWLLLGIHGDAQTPREKEDAWRLTEWVARFFFR